MKPNPNQGIRISGAGLTALQTVASRLGGHRPSGGLGVPDVIGGWSSPESWALTLILQPVRGLETLSVKGLTAFRHLVNLYRIAAASGEWTKGGGSGAEMSPIAELALQRGCVMDADGLQWPEARLMDIFRSMAHKAGVQLPWREAIGQQWLEANAERMMEWTTNGALRRRIVAAIGALTSSESWNAKVNAYQIVGAKVPMWGNQVPFLTTTVPLQNWDAQNDTLIWKIGCAPAEGDRTSVTMMAHTAVVKIDEWMSALRAATPQTKAGWKSQRGLPASAVIKPNKTGGLKWQTIVPPEGSSPLIFPTIVGGMPGQLVKFLQHLGFDPRDQVISIEEAEMGTVGRQVEDMLTNPFPEFPGVHTGTTESLERDVAQAALAEQLDEGPTAGEVRTQQVHGYGPEDPELSVEEAPEMVTFGAGDEAYDEELVPSLPDELR